MIILDNPNEPDFKHIFPTTILKTIVDPHSYEKISEEIEKSLEIQESYVPSNRIGNSPYFSNGEETRLQIKNKSVRVNQTPIEANYIADYNIDTLGRYASEQLKRYINKVYFIPKEILQRLIINSWLADYRDDKTHLLAHQHEISFINAVYYHKVNENEGGELVLYSPNSHLSYMTETHMKIFIKPEPGLLIIFPSWMLHAVNSFSTESNERRIAISITCGFDTTDE